MYPKPRIPKPSLQEMSHNSRIHHNSLKNIEENLKPNVNNRASTAKGPRSAVMSGKELDEQRTRCETAKGRQTQGAAVISRAELDALKSVTVIKTKQETAVDRTMAIEQRDQQRIVARQRKEKMQTADRLRSAKLPLSQMDQAESLKANTMIGKAQAMMDEQEDDVKQMNSMMLYSKVVTIRDQQLNENKRLEKEWFGEQRRLDTMMEIERLKDLQAQQDREYKRQVAAKEGSLLIVDQIQQRHEIRMRHQDTLDKEKEQLLMNIQKNKTEEAREKVVKAERVQKLLLEVEASNKESIKLKAMRRQEEKDLEQSIIDYQKAKDALEQEKVAEKAREAAEKEKELQKLRALQEQAADRQTEIDALKAKRAREEFDRQARASDAAKSAKLDAQKKDLEVARQRQFRDKEDRLTQQATAEREDFLRIVQKQKEEEETERQMEAQRKSAANAHRVCVQEQMAKNDSNRKQTRLDFLEEGKRQRIKIEENRDKIKRIQENKVKSLNDMEIDPKYAYELKNKKITF